MRFWGQTGVFNQKNGAENLYSTGSDASRNMSLVKPNETPTLYYMKIVIKKVNQVI